MAAAFGLTIGIVRATLDFALLPAAVDVQNLRLHSERQIVSVDHRFALSNPALVSGERAL